MAMPIQLISNQLQRQTNYKYRSRLLSQARIRKQPMKLTKADVQKQIQTEAVKGEVIYYSYAQKYQATLSIFKNQRLLIFNSNTGLLYYINQPKQLPFKTEVPKPKNDCANMNVSIAKNPPGTNQFHIQFVMRNQKNQTLNVEWNYLLENNKLAQDWLRVIQNFKNKKIQQMMDIQEKKKQQLAAKNQNQNEKENEKVNNAWIHDTLGFGLMEVSRKQQPRVEPKNQPELNSPAKKQEEPKKAPLIQSEIKNIQQPVVKPPINQSLPGKMAESKFQTSPQKKPAIQSPIKLPQPAINIHQSNISLRQSITKNIKGENLNMNESNRNIQGSNTNIRQPINNIQGSNTNIQGSIKNIQGSNTNIQGSNSNVRESKIIPNPSPIIRQSQLKPASESYIRGSQLSQNNERSPSIRKSGVEQDDPRFSKMTLRDELQSILQRSQLRQSKFESSFISQPESRISDKTYNIQNDWNVKFLKRQSEQVIIDFQQHARKAFTSILKQDRASHESIRLYFKSQLFICVANARTLQARKLKCEFRNYHFIMQSCKDNFIVGVPLSCLIQFEGLVGLVQSLIPEHAPKLQLTQQILHQIKDLQRYTRVKNNILKKAALYDLSEIYQSKHKTLIYINQLIQYLPVHLEQSYRGGLVRPEHILDNVNQFMQGGTAHQANRQDMKTLNDALGLITLNVKTLAKELSAQDIIFANGPELKNIMHQRGINLKYLPFLYTEVTNKTVKKYVHTFMAAKIAKDFILEKLSELRISSSQSSPHQTVESLLKLLMQGNNSNSNELWKQIAVRFRKEYNFAMSNHDLAGTFFLNSLMKLIPAVYDLSKLNDKKTPFKDDGILKKGFVVQLLPKVKSFYRFTTQLTDKIIFTCKQEKTEENYTAIMQQLKLVSQPIPRSLDLSKATDELRQYLSFFTCPAQFDPKSFPQLKLFQNVGQQPPTTLSLSTTRNYLQWCLRKQKLERFKQIIQQTLSMVDYWFDSSHPYHCQFLELLADYFQLTGTIDQSIKLIKESLALCIKNGAGISRKTGDKYFNLAEKELRAGRKKDSMDNFVKAKNIMENYNDQTPKYPITLMKLSSLYLNSNDFENCVIYSRKAVEKFQELENNKRAVEKGFYDRYCIKAIQIMTRAFQIQNKKNQLYRVAQLSSARYNKTKSPQVFDQLIKICLTATLLKHNQQKCDAFQSLIQKLTTDQAEQISSERCLNEMMVMAEQGNVMEKFMFKFQSLQRILADVNSRRTLANESKDFLNIVKNIVGVVGQDYIYGLIRQKEFQ